MRVSWMTVLGGAIGITGLGGCTAELEQANALLARENEDLRTQLADRSATLADSRARLREIEAELARLREQQEEFQQPLAQVTGFEDIPDVTASYGAGEVTVAVESDVLFASGKAVLKSAARRSLDEVARVLNHSYSGRPVRVEGHTDSDPIRKSGHKSNYHLGFERAYAVREYLITRGVPPERIALASFGPDEPRATKAASRRVEIVVVMN